MQPRSEALQIRICNEALISNNLALILTIFLDNRRTENIKPLKGKYPQSDIWHCRLSIVLSNRLKSPRSRRFVLLSALDNYLRKCRDIPLNL